MIGITLSHKLVFTNGVFDILHAGHVRLLEFAATQGDRLIVAINSDASAKRLKGPTRPFTTDRDRKKVLEALRYVDEVLIFEQDTPALLVEELRPHILVKGPEASGSDIPGAQFVLRTGGQVVVPAWPVTHSTTSTIERLLDAVDNRRRNSRQVHRA